MTILEPVVQQLNGGYRNKYVRVVMMMSPFPLLSARTGSFLTSSLRLHVAHGERIATMTTKLYHSQGC